MNNMKTRFVIAISQRLAAAPDSDAKVDLIEELSENLNSRCADMMASGMEAGEAFEKAMGELGDVNELLAYLDSFGGGAPQRETPGAFGDDWFQSLGGFINQTMDQVWSAVSDAAAIVEKTAERVDCIDAEFSAGGPFCYPLRTDDDEELEYPSAHLRAVKVNIVGDVTICLDGDPNAPVLVQGDVEDIQVIPGEDGVLTVTQGRTAGGNFLFTRALSSASIDLTLPQRQWEELDISTISGDISIADGVLEVDRVKLKTTSGEMELDSLTRTRRLDVETASGDLTLTDCVCDELVFHSASGDLEGENVTAAVLAETASGDVSLRGSIRALRANTASGDIELETDLLPEGLELTTKSGDCRASVPDSGGFFLRFSTVSGGLHSDFPLTTAAPQRSGWGARSGEAAYRDGGDGRIYAISTVSGEIELNMQ